MVSVEVSVSTYGSYPSGHYRLEHIFRIRGSEAVYENWISRWIQIYENTDWIEVAKYIRYQIDPDYIWDPNKYLNKSDISISKVTF